MPKAHTRARPRRMQGNRIITRATKEAERRAMRREVERLRAVYKAAARARYRQWIARIGPSLRGRVRGDRVKCIHCNRWFQWRGRGRMPITCGQC